MATSLNSTPASNIGLSPLGAAEPTRIELNRGEKIAKKNKIYFFFPSIRLSLLLLPGTLRVRSSFFFFWSASSFLIFFLFFLRFLV
jgi:hypothetical protein